MQKNSTTISERLQGILSDLSSFVGQDSSSAALPVCESRDRDSFVKRVHSFQTSSWFAKPRWLSPVTCARYGWINVDVDLLRCVGCQSVLVIRTPSSFDPAVYDACQKRLEDQLKRAAHHACCTWPSCPTPEVIILTHNGGSSQAVVVEDFVYKAQLLYSVGKDLPAVEQSCLNVTESDITGLCSLVRNSPQFQHDEEIPGALQSAVLLALTGWNLSNGGKVFPGCTSVQCLLCMRQPGLWNYISITDSNDRVPNVESHNNAEPVLDHQMNTEKESEDVPSAGSHSPDMDFQESVVTSRDAEAIHDTQDRLPSFSCKDDDEPCSLAMNSDIDDGEGITDDMSDIDEHGDHSDEPDVADSDESGDHSDVPDMADSDEDSSSSNTPDVAGSDEHGDHSDEPDMAGSDESGDHSDEPDVADNDDNGDRSDTPDVAGIDEHGDHLDMVGVAHGSGSLPPESANSSCFAVCEVEHCTELTENLIDNGNVEYDALQMTDSHLPSDTVQQEPDTVDIDVEGITDKEIEATETEQSKNVSDVGTECDNTSNRKETEFEVAGSDAEEVINDATNISTACDEHTDSHEPRENVGDYSPDEFTSSVKNVEENVHNSVDPEDLSHTSLEPPGSSVDDSETAEMEFLEETVENETEISDKCMDLQDSLVLSQDVKVINDTQDKLPNVSSKYDEQNEGIESYPQESLQKPPDADVEAGASDLTSKMR